MRRQRSHFVFLLLACAVAAVSPAGGQTPRVIHITAERFSFTPSQIVIETGEEVELRFKSDDTSHGFRIVGTDIRVTIPKRGRRESSVRFRPTTAGRYVFECNRMCGAGHHFMRGVLIVHNRPTGTSKP